MLRLLHPCQSRRQKYEIKSSGVEAPTHSVSQELYLKPKKHALH